MPREDQEQAASMAGVFVEPDVPQDAQARAAIAFAGGVIVYRQVNAVTPLIDHAKRHIAESFGPGDPLTAHTRLSAEAYLEGAERMRRDWRRDDRVRELWIDVFNEVGAKPEDTFYDWFALRVVPPVASPVPSSGFQLPAHRDSWGSNVYQQLNWWAPVFPVEAESALIVFPDYWQRPIANASASWDLAELRRLPPAERKAYPNLARVLEPVDDTYSLPIVIDPGDLACFSAQHLHASAPNRTGLARFNTECRTVSAEDVLHGRAAPNTDGAAPCVAWDWFKRITDRRNLTECIPRSP